MRCVAYIYFVIQSFFCLSYADETKFWFDEKGLQTQHLSFHSKHGKYLETHSWEVFRHKGKWCIPFESLSEVFGVRFNHIKDFDATKPIGIELNVYIPSGVTLNQAELFYSSNYIQSNHTPKIIDLNGLPRDQWVNLKIWLPNFRKNDGLDWFDVQFVTPLAYEKERLSAGLTNLFANEDIYIHSMKVLPSTVNTNALSIKPYRHLFPSMFERPEGVFVIYFVVFALISVSIFGFNRYVGIKIYLTFLFPFVASLLYFYLFGISFIDSIENRAVELERIKLENLMNSSQAVWAQAELEQQNTILLVRDAFKKIVKQKMALAPDKSMISLDETSEHFHKIANQYDMSLLVANSGKKKEFRLFGAPQVTANRWRDLVKVIYPLVFMFTSKKFPDAVGFYESHGNRLKQIYAAQNYGVGLLDEVLNIDAFVYSPNRLTRITFLDFDMEKMLQVSKEKRIFWTYFIDRENETRKGNLWVAIGFCDEPLLLRSLNKHYKRFFKEQAKGFNSPIDYVFVGRNEQVSFPIENEAKGEFLQASALSQTYRSRVLFTNLEQNKLYFYLSSLYDPLPSYNLAFRYDGTSLLQGIQQQKNTIYWISISILFLLLVLTYLLSKKVLKPLNKLKQSFMRLEKEFYDFNLETDRTDQYGNVLRKFNQMLLTLREKKFMTSFVSRMAITAIKKNETTKREMVTVLYCGIKNMNELRESEGHHEGLKSINSAICLVQECVVENKGYIDKFTGNASLALFRHNSKFNFPFKAALMVRQRLANINSERRLNGQIPILLGLGLATGPVILGHIGADKRKDFTCIGNTVNMAARLGSKFYGDTIEDIFIQMDPETCDIQMNQKFYSVTRLEDITIKGKTQKQVVYVLD
ncbi:MAG: adenylate/guanylate cyclase domain-containing protein [Candidatus Cloacimonetes bacterium]|nr:adenylate/guanylate cyclase domain-containing protein [Candidatus Cloacimonadota bacterium]